MTLPFHVLHRRLTAHRPALTLATLALFASIALKFFYATATADELRFILAPTAWLSGEVLRHRFVWIPDSGYFCEALSFLIAPACAGVNFLVIAFFVLVVGFEQRLDGATKKATWLGLSALIAYLSAIFVNGARIALSVLAARPIGRIFELSFQSAHRLIGVGAYLGGLLFVVVGVAALFRRAKSTAGALRPLAIAFGAYLAVTLFVPLLRGAGSAPEYWDHARTVAALALGLAAGAFGARILFRVFRARARARARVSRETFVRRRPFSSPQLRPQ